MIEEKYIIPDKYKNAFDFFPESWRNYDTLIGMVNKEAEAFFEMQCKFPLELGNQLQALHEDDDYLLGVHRTPKDVHQVVSTVFSKGLYNRIPEYDNTLSTYMYFPTLLKEIISCETGWRNSKGCVIVKIPKNPEVDIYRIIRENGVDKYYISPEYIVGYVSVKNREVVGFVPNPNYERNIYWGELEPDSYISRKYR